MPIVPIDRFQRSEQQQHDETQIRAICYAGQGGLWTKHHCGH